MTFDFFGGVRALINRIIYNRHTVQQAFRTDLAVTEAIEQNITRWYNEYMGTPGWMTTDVRPMGLPKAICREFRRVVTSELNIDCDGSKRADYLSEQIQNNLDRIGAALEIGLALGSLAIKPYVAGGASSRYIGLDVVSSTGFIPGKFDDAGRCISGVFKSQPVKVDGRWFVKMESHEFQDGNYLIQNKAFESSEKGEVSNEVPLERVPAWAAIQPEVTINNVENPLFGYFAAAPDSESHIGKSIYSGETEDLLRAADEQWELFRYEFKSGERKIIATDEAINHPLPGGKYNPLQNDRLYVSMPYDSEEFFKEFSPDLRATGYYDGLQAILRRIEFNVGLSYGDLSDPSTVDKTAAEVISSKNRKYSTVYDIEKRLQKAIEQAVYGMDVYTTLYNLAPKGAYDLRITWDDSILEDTSTERQRDIAEVTAGLMSKAEYRMKWYDEDEETAQKAISAINAENNSNSSSGLELSFND